MPNPKLQSFPVLLGAGGLQDSHPIPEPGDLRELQNFINFRGRWGIRPGIEYKTTLTYDGSNPVDMVYAIEDFNGYLYAITSHTSGTTTVYLNKINKSTWAEVARAALWTSVTSVQPIMTVMAGPKNSPDDGETEDRLYFCNFLDDLATPVKYITDSSDTPTTLQIPFYDEDPLVARSVYFNCMLEYQHHLWGTGWLHDDGVTEIVRPEVIRFSRPGTIPYVEPGLLDETPPVADGYEWWITDWRGIGRRGEKIMALAKAGGYLAMFKRRQLYMLAGYDRDSWAAEQVSGSVGAVGPYAADTTPEGLCFFWSENGPHFTDGQRIADIGEDIRRRVNETEYDTYISTQVSPDDGLVYFTKMRAGAAAPDAWFVFDYKRQKWAEGEWWNTSSVRLKINQLKRVTLDVLPGPVGAPSSLTATPIAGDTGREIGVDLEWINGDAAAGTITHIMRASYSGSCGGYTEIDTVGAGVTTYTDYSVSSHTAYCYKVYHTRNEQNSSDSNVESDVRTRMEEPTGFYLAGLTTGKTVCWTNVESAGTIRVQRKAIGQSYITLATPANAGVGSQTYDDETCTCESYYYWRVRAEDSGWPSSDYVASAESEECCDLPPDLLTVTHLAHILDDCAEEDEESTVSYTATEVGAGDIVKIYRGVNNGGGYSYTKIYEGQLQESDTQYDRMPLEYNLNAYTDDFPSLNLLDALGESTEVSLSPGSPFNDTVQVSYEVHLDVDGDGEDCQLAIWVAIDAYYGAAWHEEASYEYFCWSLEGVPASCDWDDEEKTVVCGGTPTKIRVRIDRVEVNGEYESYALEVHAFNLPTDGDPDYGVKYNVNEGGSTMYSKYRVEAWEQGGEAAVETMYSDEATHNNVNECS